MEAVTIAKKSSTTHVFARRSDLLSAFEQYADQIKILSLDCFDTILWRKTASPTDVFYDLQHYPHHKAANITASMRIQAEVKARRALYIETGNNEVTLHDIYRIGFPEIKNTNKLIAEELAAECAACYVYPPIIELMQAAIARGINIVIVSNTYLDNNYLRQLLSSALPEKLLESIHTIFCSCEFRQSKSNGLFLQVLKKMSAEASTILHIGDLYSADFLAAQQSGLHALHLKQFNKTIADVLRLQTMTAHLTDPQIRYQRSLSSPFRGIFASSEQLPDRPETQIGYLSLGPIFYAFAHYIQQEISLLEQTGKKVTVLFLMRDAHLPQLACDTLLGRATGHSASISRFAATAAAFRCKEDVLQFLRDYIGLDQLTLCRQCQLPTSLAAQLIDQAKKSADPNHTFFQLIQQESVLEKIFQASAKLRSRLKKHLAHLGVKEGDTVMFVDLGYSGSVQRMLATILQDEMAIDITGRYLLSLNPSEQGSSRRGLIDSTWCDERTLISLLSPNIALLEELCSNNEGSAEDYAENGKPLLDASQTTREQKAKVTAVQAECLRFIQDAKYFFQSAQTKLSNGLLRDAALTELARRLYLPLESEIAYLQSFMHDMGRGTHMTFPLYNPPDAELMLLRRRGMMFYQHPYGARPANLALSLSLMTQRRFNLEVDLEDMSFRREKILAIIMENNAPTQHQLYAQLTHDGYFSLWIPFTNHSQQVALLFGLHYQSLQIESAEFIKLQYFLQLGEQHHAEDMSQHLVLDEMIHKGGTLFECSSQKSSLLFAPPGKLENPQGYMFRVVFRPIVLRNL